MVFFFSGKDREREGRRNREGEVIQSELYFEGLKYDFQRDWSTLINKYYLILLLFIILYQYKYKYLSYSVFPQFCEREKERERRREMKNQARRVVLERPWLLTLMIAGTIGALILVNSFSRTSSDSLLCSLSGEYMRPGNSDDSPAQTQLIAILHYATSRVVPQQSLAEIRVSFDVLQSSSPCNFLVFGLGHDSLMWSSFNPKGNTLFLEEDPKWTQTVLKQAPNLRAHTVRYQTHLSEADQLLASYKSESACLPPDVSVRDNTACRLALTGLPNEVYDTEWDLIMIDAPRGYFPEAPGRMGAIFTAAVMARARKGDGPTHVFLHDVNRRIEKVYAEEFLCRKNLVKAEGRLWHFAIPPASDHTITAFC